MSIVNISRKLEEIIQKNDLTELSVGLKNEYAISKSEELEKAITQIEDEGRTLKVGIVGRVKAGKSSLLNALVFDGQNVLPKAATPMTAALTILEYSEETKAEVDFFTKEDIADIELNYNNYKKQLETLMKEEFKKLSDIKLKKLKKLTPELEEECKLKARKRSEIEMKKKDALYSAYDQFMKIKNSGISLNELEQYKEIRANSVIELNDKLYEFVGADGKYMPFTKSVTLKLKDEHLKDIQIIDTPGVNDPVTSRENRTKELLKYCDVVLVVSPSGQFLSSEDIDLMDRITTKEGINEVYIVASQVDNQLFGSEKAKGNGILFKVLEKITLNLSELQKNILLKQKEQFSEVGTTFDKLIHNNVILSSGIAYNMLKSFDNKNKWDESTQVVWKNLKEHYPDNFDSNEMALASLEKLANINNIQILVSDVKVKKDEIIQAKKDKFVTIKTKALLEYKNAIENDIKDSIQRINNSNIEDIKVQKEKLLQVQRQVSEIVDQEYLDLVDSLELELKSILNDKVKSYFKSTKNDVRDSEAKETESYAVDHGTWQGIKSLFGGDSRHETKYRDYTTVKAGYVRNSLEELTMDIEDTLDQDFKDYILNWKKSLYKSLVSSLRNEAGDEILDVVLIRRTIRGVLNSIEYPDIDYNGSMPSDLNKGSTLKGYEAEDFLTSANNYISNLNSRVRDDIKNHLVSLSSVLKEHNVSDNIFKSYNSEIEKLESDIENKELSLDRLNNISKQLGSIND